MKINVRKRLMDRNPDGSPRYIAWIDGKPGYWDCGSSSPDSAIGALIRTHPEMFGVTLDCQPDKYDTDYNSGEKK